MTDDIPEPDRLPGAPHPREAEEVFGHDAAEQSVLEACASGRMHHAWLLAGPRGIGKATFAWRVARFLLTQPSGVEADGGLFGAPPVPDTLSVDRDHPVARRMLALSEPRFHLLRRPYDQKSRKLKQDITIDATRKLKDFFALSAADGGRRVVLVDAADELNANAANAILKLLEEPPADATLLLVSHHPARLLPTIRSRCRLLRLKPLHPEHLSKALAQAGADPDLSAASPQLAELADGSAGTAWSLIESDGYAFYSRLVELLSRAPGFKRSDALALAETTADLFPGRLALVELLLARMARSGVSRAQGSEAASGETQVFQRLAPNPGSARMWADLLQAQGSRARRGGALNLDPSALLLDTLLAIDDTARRAAQS